MIWRVDVFSKEEKAFSNIVSQIKDIGIFKECQVSFRKVYLIEGKLKEKELEFIASTLLIDPIVEDYYIGKGVLPQKLDEDEIIITYNPGVCDPVATSLEKAIRDLRLEVDNIRTARFYKFKGLTPQEINYLASQLLYNPLIEHILDKREATASTLNEFQGLKYKFKLNTINILEADNAQLQSLNQKHCLSLSREELNKIKDYFCKNKRNPTDCELQTLAILWSEHCSHKTLRGVINYQERDENGKLLFDTKIDNLLKSTIFKATQEINSPHCISVFEDNAGIVSFDEDYNLAFKVETHNHPSSLEPYGGSSTGIGGVIRDILGTGRAARPFASLDVFCFSEWDISYKNLPKGLLHPKRIIKGVIEGVRDYGNRMGIPTVAGAVVFDPRFIGNPLVYCGTLGILPKNRSFKKVEKGDLIIVCGGRTGKDGIGGATFSSQELNELTVNLTTAVQIGDPIEEKKLTEAVLRAADKNLFNAITDCGAGGLCCAISELARDWGAEVYLEKVPLKYQGLTYTEIWISESQERMVIFSPEDNLAKLKEIFQEEEVELTVIGKVVDNKRLRVFYNDKKVVDLDMDFIFSIPKLEKNALWIVKKEKKIKLAEKDNYNDDLKMLLSSPNIASKEWILREYDHEVQAGSVDKSFYGIEKIRVSDAAVVKPILNKNKCIALAAGINPFYSDIDPYWMAALSLEEALRNVICKGARLSHTFILDNFSWGSPKDEEVLAGLVRAAKSCYEFSTYFGVPFISGKDSLYNEYSLEGKNITIPGTLLISSLGIIDDWSKVLPNSFQREGNLIYLIGLTRPSLGASQYFRSLKIEGGSLPFIDKKIARDIFTHLEKATQRGLLQSCHDLSEGGLGVAISEMCLGTEWGASVFLGEVAKEGELFDYEILFSESPTRFLVEVAKDKKDEFEEIMRGIPYGLIGCLNKKRRLVVYNQKCKEIINLEVKDLERSWIKTFDEFRYQDEARCFNSSYRRNKL